MDDEPIGGVSAHLLQSGKLVPPRTAKFVLTAHFMTPHPGKGAKAHALMAHAYSETAPEDAPGAAGDLLREIWRGDAVNAISRCGRLESCPGSAEAQPTGARLSPACRPGVKSSPRCEAVHTSYGQQ